MTTKNGKSAKTSKSTNTRSSIEKMNQIKITFTPLLSSKDNKARLTFVGAKHSITKDDRPIMRMVFSCMDVTRANPANIGILCSYKISTGDRKNTFTKFLDVLGFEMPELATQVIDADDEFGIGIDTQALEAQLQTAYDLLHSSVGLVFKAELNQNARGLYDLDLDTLEPLIKDGVQLRDYNSDEGGDIDLKVDFEQAAD